MKILFLYRYGILGGVCTQLFHRFRHLPKDNSLEIHCGFRSDHGVKEMLGDYATLHFGLNKETTKTFLEENKFDLIIIIDTEEYIDAIREMTLDSKIIVEVHTSIERNLEYLSRIKENDIDGFITVSDYMIGRIKHHIQPELNDKKITTFQNVLDSDLFKPIDIETSGSPVIGWVGKIDDHKDWKAFMQISSLIRKENQDVEFWIIGGQTCPEALAQEVFDYAEEVGIISKFKWIDRIENIKMSSLYSILSKRGGLSLVTSHCESFGMSVLESLLAGSPVVCTNVGALPEITDEEEYFKLYELQDYEKAATKCIEVLSKSKEINNSLSKHRANLVDKYDSSKRSIEYWHILENQVK
jgi:glycosyltransferase involved in cell wall biosynthesis